MERMMLNDKSETTAGALGVYESIDFLKKTSCTYIKIIAGLVAALLISLGGNVAFIVAEKPPVYFGLNHEMALLPMRPLSEPMITDAALKSWAAQAVTDIFNMDFVDWKSRISSARQYFSKQAFLGYANSLDKEGHIATLRQYRAIMHGVLSGTPVITASGVLKGVRTWEMEIPFILAYETSERTLSSQNFIVQLRIQRVSTAEYPKGIAISQLTISSRTKKS